ncbi:MAG: CRTAC1 family protein [Planctomycetaceae bacterium]|nr:CRTAC1 family protein [Planctomycetaceae bacterium]
MSDELESQDDAIIGTAFAYSVIFLAFVGGGVLAYFAVRLLQSSEPPPAPLPDVPQAQLREETPLDLPTLPFVDITAQAGITFRHENGARGEKLLPETMGGGCAFFDYDNDGDPDLLLTNSRTWRWSDAAADSQPTLAFYENDGQGQFHDVTAQVGLGISMYGQGVAVGDFDNDGDTDIYLTGVSELEHAVDGDAAQAPGPHRLFRNEGGQFVEITESAGVAGALGDWGTSCGWFDYDRDGDLDLWVCNYVEWNREFDLAQDFSLTGGARAYGRPQVFGGTFSRLYRNDGDAKFTDVSAEAGIQIRSPTTNKPLGKSLGVTFADFDDDGWLDVIVANDTVQNFLFRNQGNGTFVEEAKLCGIAYDMDGNSRGAMGIDVACPREELDCHAVAIGNFANEMTAFYVSLPGSMQFADEAVANGLGPNTRLYLTFGVFFADLDLDGRLDLVHANGHLEQDIAQVQRSQTYEQSPQLFWNAGSASPTEYIRLTEERIGADYVRPMVGRGAAPADIDGDGDLDIIIAATGAQPRLLRNDQEMDRHWVRVKLVGNGTTVPRDPIGARIDFTLNDEQVLRRFVRRTCSYLSQAELPLTVGLAGRSVKSMSIRWPDGTVQQVDKVPVDRSLLIEQTPSTPQAASTALPRPVTAAD